MTRVFVESNNIITPLGYTTEENVNNILSEKTGINTCVNPIFSSQPFPASYIDEKIINDKFSAIGSLEDYTRFEKLSILSIKDAIDNSSISTLSSRTLLVLSTTKGNIELLDKNLLGGFSSERLNIYTTAILISSFFNLENAPMVVSNACISGLAAIVIGQRLINQGLYDNVIVNGTDILSKFIISGFQSFLSLSAFPCKPFDLNRDGLTLGEGSATIILTKKSNRIEVMNGAISNDANHISGPSQTGEGLLIAINKAIGNNKVDLISAHGTATPYNDDMESKAISRAGLEDVPVNGLKGYFGHTLGAAGIIETIINLEYIKKDKLVKTLGCDNPSTVEKINVIQEIKEQKLNSLLKIASGFGGCNAAALFLKHE